MNDKTIKPMNKYIKSENKFYVNMTINFVVIRNRTLGIVFTWISKHKWTKERKKKEKKKSLFAKKFPFFSAIHEFLRINRSNFDDNHFFNVIMFNFYLTFDCFDFKLINLFFGQFLPYGFKEEENKTKMLIFYK